MNDRDKQLIAGLKRLIGEVESGEFDVLYAEETVMRSMLNDLPRAVVAAHLEMDIDRPMRRITICFAAAPGWFEDLITSKRDCVFGGSIDLSGHGQSREVSSDVFADVRARTDAYIPPLI